MGGDGAVVPRGEPLKGLAELGHKPYPHLVRPAPQPSCRVKIALYAVVPRLLCMGVYHGGCAYESAQVEQDMCLCILRGGDTVQAGAVGTRLFHPQAVAVQEHPVVCGLYYLAGMAEG